MLVFHIFLSFILSFAEAKYNPITQSTGFLDKISLLYHPTNPIGPLPHKLPIERKQGREGGMEVRRKGGSKEGSKDKEGSSQGGWIGEEGGSRET